MSRTGWVIAALVFLGAIGYAQQEFDRFAPTRVVTVSNFPNPQNVAGTVNVGNLPVDASGNLLVAGGGITNQVLDLVDTNVTVTYNGSSPTWESQTFDTSGFNRICVKAAWSSPGVSGYLECSTAWQMDDEPFYLVDYVSYNTMYLTKCDGDGGTWMPGVRGVRAKIICRSSNSNVRTLTDMKVLLRRE